MDLDLLGPKRGGIMTKYPLSTFTIEGMTEFQRRYELANLTGGPLEVLDMLDNKTWSKPITQKAQVEFCEFPSRRECGQHLFELLESHKDELRAAAVDPVSSVALWAWLSAVWCPWLQQYRGKPLKVGARARWIYQPTNAYRYYRHLLAGPYLIVAAHRDNPDRAQILLYNDVVKPNTRWVETICGSQQALYNKSLLEALTSSVINPRTQKIRTGKSLLTRRTKYFTSRGLLETGTVDRLTQVFNQLSEPWHLKAATPQRLAELFGTEFREFF